MDKDVADYLQAGANMVGIASQIMLEGPFAIERIYKEWQNLSQKA